MLRTIIVESGAQNLYGILMAFGSLLNDKPISPESVLS